MSVYSSWLDTCVSSVSLVLTSSSMFFPALTSSIVIIRDEENDPPTHLTRAPAVAAMRSL